MFIPFPEYMSRWIAALIAFPASFIPSSTLRSGLYSVSSTPSADPSNDTQIIWNNPGDFIHKVANVFVIVGSEIAQLLTKVAFTKV